MSFSSVRFLLGVVVALHLVLALAYAFSTPYRTPGFYASMATIIPDIGAPDELQHVDYVQRLLDGKGFPVLQVNDPELGLHYQAHQPPLYYLLAAGWASAGGRRDLGIPNAQGNKETQDFIDAFNKLSPGERIQWIERVLNGAGQPNAQEQALAQEWQRVGNGAPDARGAGMWLRALNCLIGGCTVGGVFFLGFWGLGRKDVALAAAAITALLPMNLALSGAASNDPLLYCLCTWSLAVTALCLTQGWTMKRAAILGILLGLAFLTKTTALTLAPAILFAAYCSGAPKPTLKQFGLAAGIAVLLAAPWWVRNQSLYGDPFAMKAFNLAFVNSPTRASLHMDWGRYLTVEWAVLWRSFIGVFGYMELALDESAYLLGAAVLAVLAIGAIIALRSPDYGKPRAALYLNFAFLAMVALAFAAFNLRYFQAQARYVLPAIGPISIGLATGLVYYAKARWKMSLAAWLVILTLCNLYIVGAFLPQQFSALLVQAPAATR